MNPAYRSPIFAIVFLLANIKECREVMDKIAGEVSRHYSLGYYSANAARDGQWRNIHVEVMRQPDKGKKYIARTRMGYYAPGGEK